MISGTWMFVGAVIVADWFGGFVRLEVFVCLLACRCVVLLAGCVFVICCIVCWFRCLGL